MKMTTFPITHRFLKNAIFNMLVLSSALSVKCLSQPGGNSLLFNGINNYVSIPDNPALDFSDSVSIEFWINPVSDSNHLIISKGWCLNNNHGYYIDLIGGKISFGWAPNGGCAGGITNLFRTDSSVVFPYQCTHVAVVFDIALATIYINGISVPVTLIMGNNNMPIHNSSEPLRIGVSKGLNSSLNGYYAGEIDELRLWNYKLTASEITSRMNTILTGNEPGLVAYYDFEEPGIGNGFTVINQCIATGNALDGISIGDTITPSHIPRCSIVGISENINNKDGIVYFPNPTTGIFKIDFGKGHPSSLHHITIRDPLSKIILDITTLGTIEEINLGSEIKPGLYFLEILDKQGNRMKTQKIILTQS